MIGGEHLLGASPRGVRYYGRPGDGPTTSSLEGLRRPEEPSVFLYRSPSELKPVEFSVSAAVVEQISSAWHAENGAYGGREVGGWLCADPAWPAAVVYATDSTVEAHDYRLLKQHWMHAEAPAHLTLVGSWHTHPAGDAGVPSQTDLEAFHACLLDLLDLDRLARHGCDRTLDLIAVPRENGSLALHGWSTRLRAGLRDRAKCEPARVTELP